MAKEVRKGVAKIKLTLVTANSEISATLEMFCHQSFICPICKKPCGNNENQKLQIKASTNPVNKLPNCQVLSVCKTCGTQEAELICE